MSCCKKTQILLDLSSIGLGIALGYTLFIGDKVKIESENKDKNLPVGIGENGKEKIGTGDEPLPPLPPEAFLPPIYTILKYGTKTAFGGVVAIVFYNVVILMGSATWNFLAGAVGRGTRNLLPEGVYNTIANLLQGQTPAAAVQNSGPVVVGPEMEININKNAQDQASGSSNSLNFGGEDSKTDVAEELLSGEKQPIAGRNKNITNAKKVATDTKDALKKLDKDTKKQKKEILVERRKKFEEEKKSKFFSSLGEDLVLNLKKEPILLPTEEPVVENKEESKEDTETKIGVALSVLGSSIFVGITSGPEQQREISEEEKERRRNEIYREIYKKYKTELMTFSDLERRSLELDERLKKEGITPFTERYLKKFLDEGKEGSMPETTESETIPNSIMAEIRKKRLKYLGLYGGNFSSIRTEVKSLAEEEGIPNVYANAIDNFLQDGIESNNSIASQTTEDYLQDIDRIARSARLVGNLEIVERIIKYIQELDLFMIEYTHNASQFGEERRIIPQVGVSFELDIKILQNKHSGIAGLISRRMEFFAYYANFFLDAILYESQLNITEDARIRANLFSENYFNVIWNIRRYAKKNLRLKIDKYIKNIVNFKKIKSYGTLINFARQYANESNGQRAIRILSILDELLGPKFYKLFINDENQSKTVKSNISSAVIPILQQFSLIKILEGEEIKKFKNKDKNDEKGKEEKEDEKDEDEN